MNSELLKIKEKIVLNGTYKDWMKQIVHIENEFAQSSEFNNTITLDHGIDHMDRVASNMYNLMKEYKCCEKDCIIGYITGLIHDIGMIKGKKGHAQTGAEMAEEFLRRVGLVYEDDFSKIKNAIKNHGNGGDNPDILTSFLAITDKADMCKARSLGKLSPIQLIENYTIEIENNILKINYNMKNLKGKEGLYIIPKTIDIPKILGTYLGLEVQFFINGKEESFVDREVYEGPIYQRKE